MNGKLDRRKKYTQMVLKDSLIALLKDNPIASITIKELCEVADINRSTFYAHYSSQYDLLYAIEEELIEDMIAELSQYNVSDEEDSLKMTEKILEYIVSKRDLCPTLLSENSDTHFLTKGMMIVKQFMYNDWVTSNQSDQEAFEYVSLFVVSGSIHVIKRWLENGLDQTPGELAEILNSFTGQR